MAEWSNAAVLKTAEPETVPGVRIPLLPPISLYNSQRQDFLNSSLPRTPVARPHPPKAGDYEFRQFHPVRS